MNLSLPAHLGHSYKSPAQKARVITEEWGRANLYCPACPSPFLTPTSNNTKAFDYVCSGCQLTFQLKSKKSPIGERILDSAFDTMMKAISEDRTPNLYALQYDKNNWLVKNLILIPHFAFSPSAIEARKPLSMNARRAGWVGCFIVLKNIPREARIQIISDGQSTPSSQVRNHFHRLQPLREISVKQRGWTLDVLRIVQSLGKLEFTNDDIYSFVPHLEKLHPGNKHIRDKIRQQLQILRDGGFLTQPHRGAWVLKAM